MGDHSLEARMEGGASPELQNQEAARLGLKRTPDDIPKQGKPPGTGYKTSAVSPAHFWPSTAETHAYYQIGGPRRPNIVHDRGFLIYPRRAVTAEDYKQLALWRAMLEGGDAFRPDLSDALAAYRHFLDGKGKTRLINYERYVMGDGSGRVTLRNAILEFQYAATELALNHPERVGFQMTGPCSDAEPTRQTGRSKLVSSPIPQPRTGRKRSARM